MNKHFKNKILNILNKIFSVQILAVFIATMQLLIALPQLKWAYDSLSDKSSENLEKAVQNFSNHTAAFTLINITDTIKDKNVLKADKYLKQIFAYSQIIAHFDYSDNGMDNENYANLWFERLKRLVIVLGDLNQVECNLTTEIDDPLFRSLLTLYISPNSLNSNTQKLESFYNYASNSLNSGVATAKDVYAIFPITTEMINSIDSQTVQYTKLLNVYIFIRTNNINFPKFEIGGKSLTFSNR